MKKKNPLLQILQCDTCHFSTKNAYIYKRHKIRCKRENTMEKPIKIKPSGALLFASASKLKKVNSDFPDPSDSSPEDNGQDGIMMESAMDMPAPSIPKSAPEKSLTIRERNAYVRTYRCNECPFYTNKSKAFLYHGINAHKQSWSIFCCNFCEYSCKHRHKVQRHLKLVHRYSINVNDIIVEYQCPNQPLPTTRPVKESPVKNISPLKVKIALTTPASRQAARGKDLPVGGLGKHIVEVESGGKKLYKCRYCMLTNEDKYRVSKHVQGIHINPRIYKCTQCSFKTAKKKDYYIHKMKHSTKKVELYQCPECNYTSDFKPNLDRHRVNHLNSFAFKCQYCTYSCDHEGTVKRHMAVNHTDNGDDDVIIFPETSTGSEEPAAAENDDMESATDNSVNGDSNMSFDLSENDISADGIPSLRTVEGKFFCPICGLKYRRSGDLNRHMKGKHRVNIKDYLRNQGNKPREGHVTYDDTMGSDQEEDQNSQDVPVDLSISADSALNFVGFTKEKLKCTYCSYLAKWPSDLRRHMSVHTIEKRYKCPKCFKQYKYVGDLNVHLRRDHNQEPDSVKLLKVQTIPNKKSSPAMFRCPCCSYTSPWKSEVDRHSKLHKEDKPFRCLNCDYQTHWKGDLRRHMYKHHPEVMTEGVILEDVIEVRLDKLRSSRHKESFQPLEGADEMMDDSNVVFSGEELEEEPMELDDDSQGDNSREFGDDQDDDSFNSKKDGAFGVFNCQYCSFVTNAPSKLSAHVETHTNLKQYMCPVCGRRANWKWDVRKHIRKEHPDSALDVVKLSKQEAEATIQTYMDSNPCVRREHHLNAQGSPTESEEHGQGTYHCGACEYSSKARVSVSRHIRTSHSGQSVDISYQENDDEVSFKVTPKVSTPVASSKVPETFSFSDMSPMAVESLSMQTADKPYMCAECGKSGSIKADIKKHYHYRHANQPIKILFADGVDTKFLPVEACTPGKGMRKSSSTSDTMKTSRQLDNASGASSKRNPILAALKPFVCAECGKRGGSKADIKKHYNYIHPGMEVRIKYQENAAPPDDKFKTPTGPASSPGKGAPPLSSDPKVFGYIKPFKCSACGHRSNWKWDLKKHIRMKHNPEDKADMIMMSEEEARSSYEQYMLEFNHSVQHLHAVKKDKIKMVITKPQTMPSKGVYKEFKCSGCPYRSNWRSDIHRHTKRKHGGRAHVSVMDMEEAKASLTSYDYNPRARRNRHDEGGEPERKRSDNAATGYIWKCGRCSYKNKDRKMVVKHLSTHNIRAFKCTVCSYTTNYRSSAYRHLRVRHKSENINLCKTAVKFVKMNKDVADEGVDSPEDSYFSLNDAEPESYFDVFRCKLCQFQSSWRSCITRHMKEKHKGNAAKYVRVRKYVKDKGADSPSKLSKSKRKHSCHICPFRTTKAVGLRFHLSCHKKQTGVKQEKCPYCPYYVVAHRLLRQHIKLHEQDIYSDGSDVDSEQEEFQDSFSVPTTPVKEMKAPVVPAYHGTPKRHRCEKCPYTSNSKNDYLYHKQFHKPKPGAEFKCRICEYWVTHKRLLKQHMKVHEAAQSPSKNSVQSSPCKSDFSESSSVYDMVQLATYKQKVIASKIMPSISQKPVMSPMKIACSVGNKPGYVFRNGVYKKLHKCKKCPYMNVRLRNLNLHEMMHGGGRTSKSPLMKCPHCDYYVGSRGLLSHHLKVHQPGYMADISDSSISDFEPMDGVKMEDDHDEKSEPSEIPFESKVDTLYEIARFKKYSCEKCPYASAKRSHYERHVELHGSRQRCSCRYCDYSVPSRNLLAQHEKLHMVPNQNLLVAQSLSNLLQLPQVPADVALASALPPLDTKEAFTVNITHDHLEMYENSAEAENEPKKLYRCDRCPYANVRRDHLLSHLKFHMVKSDLACPYCDYSASKQHLLNQHIKVHFSPLPELSNWLAQNGQMDRVQENKDTDISEAIRVAQLLQGKTVKGIADDSKETNEKKTNTAAVDKVDDKQVKEAMKEGETTLTEPKEDNSDQSLKNAEAMDVDDGEQPSTSSDCQTSSIQPTESKDEEEDKEEDKIDQYICQYCDREFLASDQLLRHEMQHLIGNNFEGYIYQVHEEKSTVGKALLPPPAVPPPPVVIEEVQNGETEEMSVDSIKEEVVEPPSEPQPVEQDIVLEAQS